MFAFAGLHSLAAPRGDGLRPELLELIASRQALAASNVEDISAHLADHFIQAGPNPVGRATEDLPAVVIPFRRLPNLGADAIEDRPSRKSI